jgi:hypothetical protein
LFKNPGKNPTDGNPLALSDGGQVDFFIPLARIVANRAALR